MVLHAYVDESYDSSFYFIAAAIAPEEVWDDVDSDLEAIRRRTADEHATPRDAEFHGYELMGGRGDWKALRGKHREAAGIYRACLLAAKDRGVTFILRGVDVHRLNARYRYPDQPHTVVLSHLLERVNEFARYVYPHETEHNKVLVVADEIATQKDHLAQFEAYQERGTNGYRSSKLERIAAPIYFESSRAMSGLQVADLAAYLHRRRSTVEERTAAGRAAQARLCAVLDACTRHHHTWMP